MGRAANLSPLGLYNWDSTIFDLMRIPEALDKDTLIDNLLAETAELEVLYPNPIVFKNLVGVWSAKQIDIWDRLYATTQYEYNPIENYNRYETGSESGTGNTTHSGTDSTTESSTHGGKDIIDTTGREGGSESENTTSNIEQGGRDVVTGSDTKGHWIAGFDSQPVSTQEDGLVKQTRDQDSATTTTDYGKTEDGTGTKTTTFGKTDTVQETKTYGETISKTGGLTHGEKIQTSSDGEHELHAHGNIGITTTQKLIREQRAIDLFNLYDIIIEDFKMRFCILVY